MINTVAQGVLGRNRSLSVDGLLRSARIWAWSFFAPYFRIWLFFGFFWTRFGPLAKSRSGNLAAAHAVRAAMKRTVSCYNSRSDV